MSKTVDFKAIYNRISIFVESGQVVELRAIKPIGGKYLHNLNGYFNSLEEFSKVASELSGHFEGVYFTLNPIAPEILEKFPVNKVAPTRVATRDQDILKRKWIPIDIDPVRNVKAQVGQKYSSSKDELELAIKKARQIRDWLNHECGWKNCLNVLAQSGNGAHLEYLVNLSNTDESRDLIKALLTELDAKFSDETARVDTAVYNSGRIWKVYGTQACKGENTPDRPHRVAEIIETNPGREVPLKKIQKAIGYTVLPSPAPGTQIIEEYHSTPGQEDIFDDLDELECNQWISQAFCGVDQGDRNTTCTRLAGYLLELKTSNGRPVPQDIIRSILETWNIRNRPMLDPKEIDKVLKSVSRRVQPGRKPVPPDNDEPKQLIKIATDPPSYKIITNSGKVIMHISDKEMFSWPLFRKKWGNTIGRIPRFSNQKKWIDYLDSLMEEMTVEEAPDDSSEEKTIFQILSDFLMDCREAETVNDFKSGYIRRADGYIYFYSTYIWQWLNYNKKIKIKKTDLWRIIADECKDPQSPPDKKKVLYIDGKTIRGWGIPDKYINQ